MFRHCLAAILTIAISFTTVTSWAADTAVQEVTAPELKLAPGEMAIYVSNMHCSHCAKKIASKLYRLKGVVKVKTDVKLHLAIVTPQAKKQVDSKAAWAAVRSAGFKPTKLVGPQGTFVVDAKTKEPVKIPQLTASRPS
jgi:copper chaperone CopZ